MLDFWQLPITASEVYIGQTGLNNPQTATMPEAAPSVLHRVRGTQVEFATVLEPHRGKPRVKHIKGNGATVTITLDSGRQIAINLDELQRR
jgi:hypothetical protein